MSEVGICGCTEMFGDGTELLKLQTNRPKVFIRDRLPNWSQDDIWNWLEEGYNRWAAYADIKPIRIDNPNSIGSGDILQFITVATPQEANWPNGVLADQRLPYNGGQVLPMRINVAIDWFPTDKPMPSRKVDPIRTLCHETGHFLGHQHWPVGSPAELMEPVISQTIIGPQPTEGKVTAGWFGPPVTTPAPAENEWKITGTMPCELLVDPSGKFSFNTRGQIVILNNGQRYTMQKSLFKHVE